MPARRLAVASIATLACVLLGFGTVLWHDGYRLYIVHTGSMKPTLESGDIIIDKPVDAHTVLTPGEIITFRHSDQTTDVVTHRFVSYTATGLINTKGDANETADPWQIRPAQVKGAEARVVPRLGYLIVFLRQPSGVAAVVTSLLGLILLWGLFFPASAQQVLRRIPGTHRRSRHTPAHVFVARRAIPTRRAAPTPWVAPTPRAAPTPWVAPTPWTLADPRTLADPPMLADTRTTSSPWAAPDPWASSSRWAASDPWTEYPDYDTDVIRGMEEESPLEYFFSRH
jgi:signal peptidase I